MLASTRRRTKLDGCAPQPPSTTKPRAARAERGALKATTRGNKTPAPHHPAVFEPKSLAPPVLPASTHAPTLAPPPPPVAAAAPAAPAAPPPAAAPPPPRAYSPPPPAAPLNFAPPPVQHPGKVPTKAQFDDAIEYCKFAIAACEVKDTALALDRLRGAFTSLS